MSMITLNLHLEILDKQRSDLLDKLIPHTDNFVLSGGTALALQLVHRESYDFDFFSLQPIPKSLSTRLSQQISIKTVSQDTSDEFTFFSSDEIKVTFLQYPFPPIYPPLKSGNSLKFFPVEEIAVQKAYTIGRRGEYRDYFDLYTILKSGNITIARIISDAEKKYGNVFNPKLFLEQLVYFDDLKNFEIIPVQNSTIPHHDQVQEYFKNSVKKYIDEQE